jgi:hypothetical protein
MAEGLILRVVQQERYRSDDLDLTLDRLEAQGRLEEARALMNGRQPRVQTFAGATINEEDS